tara:strand:- start:114 stop:416 length:303 start_codon:yes stop_codon:yes gene_type:complete
MGSRETTKSTRNASRDATNNVGLYEEQRRAVRAQEQVKIAKFFPGVNGKFVGLNIWSVKAEGSGGDATDDTEEVKRADFPDAVLAKLPELAEFSPELYFV